MASINLIEAFQEFKDAENIDRPTMMKVVEDVFKTLLRKKFGSDESGRFVNGILDRVKDDLTRPLREAGPTKTEEPD